MATLPSESLQPGDLLFVNLSSTDTESNQLTAHAGELLAGSRINHVAMVVNSNEVVEARPPIVQQRSIGNFFAPHLDHTSPNAELFKGRLSRQHRHLIPQAVEFALSKIGLPYDNGFSTKKDSYYCSELIVDAFRAANNGEFLFAEHRMDFTHSEGSQMDPRWIEYYAALGRPLPQGAMGSHPAALMRSSLLDILPLTISDSL